MAEVRTALAQKFSKRLPESFLPDEAAILARAYLDDGNLPAAKKLMETGSTTIKQSELQHLKALLAASYGEWKNAITEINHALLHEPGNPVLLNDLGIFEWNAGELDRAERAFSKALSAAPQLEEPALNLALLLTELDRPQDAHQLLTSLPESAKSHGVNLLLGDIEEKRGGFVAAENHFQKALSLMPQITAPYIRLARLAANRGNLEKAYESYAQALALDPDDAELRAELAKMLCHFGMITEAVGQLEAASRSLPANTDIKLMLAEAMEKLGNKNPAIETIYSALQQQPLNAGLHIFLSRAQYNAGRLSDAVASAAQAALLEPDSREALHLYSELSGIQKDAIEILRKRKRGESQ